MKIKGIDVSYHNGKIDWKGLKDKIDFAMIRCGYGKNHIDNQFLNNARGCQSCSIPFGVYWFSYALNPKEARQEADYCCDMLTEFNLLFPVAFDFEYGSENYAKKQGKTFTKEQRVEIARAFLVRVEERGYYPLLYTNEDYIKNRGFGVLVEDYDIWYARYSTKPTPGRDCEMWQYGTETILDNDKVLERVDVNYCFKDYPSIINPYHNVHDLSEEDISEIINKSDLYYLTRDYINLAFDIIAGKYGVGNERKKNVEDLGYNYDVAQSVVNTIIHR